MKEKIELYVARDIWGYVRKTWAEEPAQDELKAAFGLSPEADLGYAQGSHGWEGEDDWCACGDMDCRPRVQQGGNSCPASDWD